MLVRIRIFAESEAKDLHIVLYTVHTITDFFFTSQYA
jgi:hypothetical protein